MPPSHQSGFPMITHDRRSASAQVSHQPEKKDHTELEVQLGKVERKLRLDRLYASRPPKVNPRVYF